MASNGLRLLWRWTLISNCRNLRDASLPLGKTVRMGRVRITVDTFKRWFWWFVLKTLESRMQRGKKNFATFSLIFILRIVVTRCFWKEILYLVIFVRDNPLFDRLTFTIFIFKDINNEHVFCMYPNLLISSRAQYQLDLWNMTKSRNERAISMKN